MDLNLEPEMVGPELCFKCMALKDEDELER
jgi:hypothetical protein